MASDGQDGSVNNGPRDNNLNSSECLGRNVCPHQLSINGRCVTCGLTFPRPSLTGTSDVQAQDVALPSSHSGSQQTGYSSISQHSTAVHAPRTPSPKRTGPATDNNLPDTIVSPGFSPFLRHRDDIAFQRLMLQAAAYRQRQHREAPPPVRSPDRVARPVEPFMYPIDDMERTVRQLERAREQTSDDSPTPAQCQPSSTSAGTMGNNNQTIQRPTIDSSDKA